MQSKVRLVNLKQKKSKWLVLASSSKHCHLSIPIASVLSGFHLSHQLLIQEASSISCRHFDILAVGWEHQLRMRLYNGVSSTYHRAHSVWFFLSQWSHVGLTEEKWGQYDPFGSLQVKAFREQEHCLRSSGEERLEPVWCWIIFSCYVV